MPQDVKRGYADFADGQIHYRMARPATAAGKRPLVLFHGSPASSRSLERMVRAFGPSRPTVAFDALGQGDSDPPRDDKVGIAYFAAAVAQALQSMGPDFAQVDAFGTHTGGRIATELAINHRAQVNRIILDGMRRGVSPFWHEYADSLDYSRFIDQDGTQFHKSFMRTRDIYLFFPPYRRDAAHRRGDGLPPAIDVHEDAIEGFKAIRHGHIAYKLAVLYPADKRLPLIPVPVLATCARLDGPHGELADVTRMIPGAQMREHPQDARIGEATDAEIVALCAMLAAWLDS